MIAALRSVPAVSLAAFYRLFPLGVLAGGLACLLDLYGAGWLYRQMNGLDVMPADMTYSQFNRGVMIFTFSLLGVWPCLLSPVWQGRSKILMIGALALAAGFVIAGTSSQSAQMALVLAVIMMALFPVSRPKACYALAGFVVLALAAAPVAAQILFDMLAPTIESAPWLKDGYAASRLEIWNFIAARALQSPWIGFGAEATRVITDFETQRLYHPDSFVLHPHNFALQVWIEFGALGALVCAGFLCDIIRRIWRLPGRLTRQVALGVFVAIISSAATSYGLWQGWWIGTFFMMIGIVTALDRLDQATKET